MTMLNAVPIFQNPQTTLNFVLFLSFVDGVFLKSDGQELWLLAEGDFSKKNCSDLIFLPARYSKVTMFNTFPIFWNALKKFILNHKSGSLFFSEISPFGTRPIGVWG